MLSGPMFEPNETANFRKIDSRRDNHGAHYSIYEIKGGMDALREIFPEGKADEMNFVLFSTSGVHGSYTSIEEVDFNADEEGNVNDDLTVLIIQPRIVCLRFGTIKVTPEDIEWLKSLRQSSWDAVLKIGSFN